MGSHCDKQRQHRNFLYRIGPCFLKLLFEGGTGKLHIGQAQVPVFSVSLQALQQQLKGFLPRLRLASVGKEYHPPRCFGSIHSFSCKPNLSAHFEAFILNSQGGIDILVAVRIGYKSCLKLGGSNIHAPSDHFLKVGGKLPGVRPLGFPMAGNRSFGKNRHSIEATRFTVWARPSFFTFSRIPSSSLAAFLSNLS